MNVGGLDYMLAPHDVGLDGLVGEEFATGHLLESRGMENEVGPDHGRVNAVPVPHVPKEELHPGVPEFLAHLILLGFIAAQHVHGAGAAVQQVANHRLAEGAGATGDRHGGPGEGLIGGGHHGSFLLVMRWEWRSVTGHRWRRARPPRRGRHRLP